MTRRKKIMLVLAGLLLIAVVGGYFLVNIVLDRATRQAMEKAVSLGQERGLAIENPDFDTVGLSGPQSAMWSGLRAKIKLPEGADSTSERWWEVHVNAMDVGHSFSDYSIVKIDRVTITSTDSDDESTEHETLPSSQRVIELKGILCRCPLSLFNPEKSLRDLLPEIINLLSATEFRLPLDLGGSLKFSLRGEPVEVGITVDERDGAYALRLLPKDISKLSSRFDEDFTSAEVELIASYPLRAARLMEIKDAAESDSRAAHERDASVPEDAYRHVLWSYLLAKMYGEGFAKRVGDAHESGETGNSPAERAMDYHNNRIGRSYAEKEFARSSILERVLADPNVRREP